MSELKPIVFINGDETTRIVASKVREGIFKDFPTVDIDLGAKSRLETKDAVIQQAADALKDIGAGVKISTASNDAGIKAAGMKSANIELRPAAGAYVTLRMTQAAGTYKKPVAILRYLKGGFYDECAYDVDENGVGTLTQRVDFSSVEDVANLAIKISKEKNMTLAASSKWTIAPSEKAFMDRIKKVWDGAGVQYNQELTDIAIANLPHRLEGGWLHVFDNPNGDTASDVADIQHGGHVMGSALYCKDGDNEFVYEELPGGTAPDKVDTDLKGPDFFNPLSTIFAFAAMFEEKNPAQKPWLDSVRQATLDYLNETPAEQKGTDDMIAYIAGKAGGLAANAA